MEGRDKYVNKVGERYRDELKDLLRKNIELLNVLSNESIEVVLQWVDKFDTAPKNKEVQYTNTSKILGKKK